jgi:MinD superfamily P-loop ATPase
MKSIVVLSGKGGVGKSSISASLALAFSKDKKIICADCDVDASNLALLFGIKTDKYNEWKKISTNKKAIIDIKKCNKCYDCVNNCYFNALIIKDNFPKVNKFICEGCGLCEIICKKNAIKLKEINNANIGYAKTKNGFFIVSGQLMPGGSGSGKVVFEVKKKANELATNIEYLIIDSAAGIGCPVISSVSGSDYAVLITEPTLAAFSDLKRAINIVDNFKIKKGIIINKYDLNENYSKKIELFAKKNKINILSKISFDKNFIKAMVDMKPIYEFNENYKNKFENIKLEIIKNINS